MRETLLNKNSKVILAALLFVLIIVPLVLNNKNIIKKLNRNKNIYYHEEKGIIKEEQIDGIKFTNISLITKNNQTTFSADVTNVSKEDIKTENLNVDLINKKKQTVITLVANIPNGLKKGESKRVTAVAKGEFKDVITKVIRK